MPTKLKVLQQLGQSELQWIAESHDLAVADWRRLDDLIDAVRVLSKAKLVDALQAFDRDRLKQMCRRLDLDDTGKMKLELAERIVGIGNEAEEESDEDEGDEGEKDQVDKVKKDVADEDDDRGNRGDRVERNKGKPEPLRIFIGSSVESLRIAKFVQLELHHDFDVTVWNQNVFEPGVGTWDQLVKMAREDFDFALFVFGADDTTESRGLSSPSTRDNVLLEYGLFVGALGPQRTFFMHNREHKPKLASDLAGVIALTYRDQKNLQAAVGPPCTQLQQLCEKRGRRP